MNTIETRNPNLGLYAVAAAIALLCPLMMMLMMGGRIRTFQRARRALRAVRASGGRKRRLRGGPHDLDHVSFAVADRAALDAAAGVLVENGVQRGGIKDIGTGWILEFRGRAGPARGGFGSIT